MRTTGHRAGKRVAAVLSVRYGLAPGAYVVAALPQFTSGPAELHAMTPAEIDAALQSLQARQRPGTAPATPNTASSPRRMYVPVFHPSATSQSDAAAVKVSSRE